LGYRALPQILFEGKQYFADLRLNEFRPVDAFESIPFDSEEGQVMCSCAGVITCENCGMSVLVSMAHESQPLRCMQCFSPVKPSHNE
jgi:hypothetical protein